MNYQDAYRKLEEYGQQHVLNYYEELNDEEKADLLRQIEETDFSIVKIGSLPMLVTDYVANGSFASLKQNVKLYQEPNYAYFVRNTDLKSNSFGVYVDQHSYDFLS